MFISLLSPSLPSGLFIIRSLPGFSDFSLVFFPINLVYIVKIISARNYFDRTVPMLKNIKWLPLSVEEQYCIQFESTGSGVQVSELTSCSLG